MAEQTRAAGNIYDLGYRPYTGPRLGRRYAVTSLYWYSLRAIFGLGRSAWSKVFPFGLAVIALIPASVQLAIAALAPKGLTFIKPEEYFSYVQIILALFCAVAAPEIIGRDQRNRTLALYFSRALSRVDYVSAKLGALVLALGAVLLFPQIVLFAGSAVADDDLVSYLQDNIDRLPAILASSALAAAFMATVSLTIASMTSRRAFSTGAVLAYFVVSTTLGAILVETTSGEFQKYSLLLSPVQILDGAVHWLFSAAPPFDSGLAKAGLDGWLYVVAALVYTGAAAGLLYRRFIRMSV